MPRDLHSRRELLKRLSFGAVVMGSAPAASAVNMRLEIAGVGTTRFPVAVSAFEGDKGLAEAFSAILWKDFERSGMLRPIAPMPLGSEPAADVQVQGSVTVLPNGQLSVRWTLVDPLRREQVSVQEWVGSANERRHIAHRIADRVQELLTGVRGVNATRVAYVVQEGRRHALKVADADGHNPRTAVISDEPIISPSWSPDGRKLAYVSFESGRAQIWAQDILSGHRQLVAPSRGTNSAPAWSPDGSMLAFASSRYGGMQLMVAPLQGGAVRRVAASSAIDTEPVWSPDGGSLFFTSDRGGAPQIYRYAFESQRVERMTFDAYSVSASINPAGDRLAYVSRKESGFHVMLKDLQSSLAQAITPPAPENERPSFAPNGRLVLYAVREGRRDYLVCVSTDGHTKTRLLESLGDVREPAWGPWTSPSEITAAQPHAEVAFVPPAVGTHP